MTKLKTLWKWWITQRDRDMKKVQKYREKRLQELDVLFPNLWK